MKKKYVWKTKQDEILLCDKCSQFIPDQYLGRDKTGNSLWLKTTKLITQSHICSCKSGGEHEG